MPSPKDAGHEHDGARPKEGDPSAIQARRWSRHGPGSNGSPGVNTRSGHSPVTQTGP